MDQSINQLHSLPKHQCHPSPGLPNAAAGFKALLPAAPAASLVLLLLDAGSGAGAALQEMGAQHSHGLLQDVILWHSHVH